MSIVQKQIEIAKKSLNKGLPMELIHELTTAIFMATPTE